MSPGLMSGGGGVGIQMNKFEQVPSLMWWWVGCVTYPMMHVMCLVPPSVDRQTPVKIGAGGKKDDITCTIHSKYLEGHLVSFHGVLNVFCVSGDLPSSKVRQQISTNFRRHQHDRDREPGERVVRS